MSTVDTKVNSNPQCMVFTGNTVEKNYWMPSFNDDGICIALSVHRNGDRWEQWNLNGGIFLAVEAEFPDELNGDILNIYLGALFGECQFIHDNGYRPDQIPPQPETQTAHYY
tara:strand:- start:968 stop:1303 length:336 start_codon:yes stop_codon:yes gene_type:complete